MKRKLYKVVALLMALAMLAGLALSEGELDALDMGFDLQQGGNVEIDETQIPDTVEEMQALIDLAGIKPGNWW